MIKNRKKRIGGNRRNGRKTGRLTIGRRSTGRRMTKAQREQQRLHHLILIGVALLCMILIIGVLISVFRKKEETKVPLYSSDAISAYLEPTLDVQLLTQNEYSRPGIATQSIDHIVIHYTANPGSTAQDNRDYFENLKNTGATYASSHFVVGLEGEIIQCVPTSEMSYASNDLNSTCVSIENCHPDETGQFNQATYDSLVQLTAWLCSRHGLTTDQVIRHYDITGKDCPRWFVQNPEEWTKFKEDVQRKLEEANENAEKNS